MIKVGIVGCGGIAHTHAIGYKFINDAKLIAACDLDEVKCNKFIKEYNISRCYNNFEKMLEDDDIDLIDLCTPPSLHKNQILKSFSARKHLVVEKPPVMTIEEMNEICEAYKNTDTLFCVIHNQRFEKSIIEAKDMVTKGKIGDIVGIDIYWQNQPDKDCFVHDQNNWCHSMPGGRWTELMPHYIYLSRLFLGPLSLKNAYVTGNLIDYPWMISSDALVILTAVENPSYACFRFTQRSESGKQILMTIYGTKGHIYIERQKRAIKYMKTKIFNQKDSAIYYIDYNKNTASAKFKIRTTKPVRLYGHAEELKLLVEAIRTGSPSPVSFNEAYEVMLLTEEIGKVLEETRM